MRELVAIYAWITPCMVAVYAWITSTIHSFLGITFDQMHGLFNAFIGRPSC